MSNAENYQGWSPEDRSSAERFEGVAGLARYERRMQKKQAAI